MEVVVAGVIVTVSWLPAVPSPGGGVLPLIYTPSPNDILHHHVCRVKKVFLVLHSEIYQYKSGG